MRIVAQRVLEANLKINGEVYSSINQGLLVFVCVSPYDTINIVEQMAKKCLNLRIFSDEDDKMNRSLHDIGGNLMIVSQFTLMADCSKGNRPYFNDAAKPDIAVPLYEHFVDFCKLNGFEDLKTGVFGADMKISLINDGPVTIILDSKQILKSNNE